MAEFSIVDAALSGPRLIARQPRTYFLWVLFHAVVGGAYLALCYLLFGSIFRSIFQAAIANQQPSRELFLSLIPRFGLAILVIMPAAIVYFAVTRTAPLRAFLQSKRPDAFGYLRLGGDEVRVFVTLFVLGCIRFAVQIVVSIPAGIIVASLLAASGGLHGAPEQRIIFQQFANLLIFPAIIFIYLKFALAAPQTLDEKRIHIFESWNLTNGHFWSMFLTYLIVFLISLVAGVLTGVVVFGAVAGLASANLGTLIPLFRDNPQEGLRMVMNLMLPLSVTLILVSAFVTPFVTALYSCPTAYIYRAITGRTEDAF
jgi:hypothetical protein